MLVVGGPAEQDPAGLRLAVWFLPGQRVRPGRVPGDVRPDDLDIPLGLHTISAKIDHALAYFRELGGTSGIEVRTHGTVLYNSIYRFDDEMVVNPHVFGKMAPHAPALHLRRLSAGTLFTTYAESFEAVWEQAKPHEW